jgi:hypothetical protein
MKIIHVIAGKPQVIYLTELYNALKSIGVDNKIYCFSDTVNVFGHYDTSHIKNVDFSQEVFDELNSCDYIFYNDLPMADYPKRKEFADMVIDKITTKQILFNNIHSYRAAVKYYGDLLKNEEFMKSFDKYVTFSKNNLVYKKYCQVVGEDYADSRYVHMLHPYKFDDEHKLWKDFDFKKKRITYLGRPAKFKDPCRLIKMNINGVADAGYECEMRGILMTIGCTGLWNLRFKFDENDKPTKEISPYTFFPSVTWRQEHGLDKKDPLIDYPRIDKKVWVFGPYSHDEGMSAISNSMFGADFYGFDEDVYGDQIEYVFFEMVDAGVIPIFDKHCGECCHTYINGESTGKSFAELETGLFVDKNCDNIGEVLIKMNKYSSDKDFYESERKRIYDLFKKHTDPQAIANNLLEELKK